MKFKIDHNYHIHTHLSICSDDSEQNIDNIVLNSKRLGYKKICITDHCWASDYPCNMSFYKIQNFDYVTSELPYKKYDDIEILFGIETDLDKDNHLGVSKEVIDKIDFLIIPVNHFHLAIHPFMTLSIEETAKKYVERIDAVLNMDLPFNKVGLAHLTTRLVRKQGNKEYLDVYNSVSDEEYLRLFNKAREKGVGIEINVAIFLFQGQEREDILRVYRLAKKAGCKFYLGGDEHHLSEFDRSFKCFNDVIDEIGLEEEDKFYIK